MGPLFACFAPKAEPAGVAALNVTKPQSIQELERSLEAALQKITALEKEVAQAKETAATAAGQAQRAQDALARAEKKAADAAAELRLRETVWRQRENTLCAHVAQLQSSLAQSKGGLAPSFSNKSLGRLSGTSSADGAAQEADEVQIVPTTSLVLNNQGRLISEGGAAGQGVISACASVMPSGISATSGSSYCASPAVSMGGVAPPSVSVARISKAPLATAATTTASSFSRQTSLQGSPPNPSSVGGALMTAASATTAAVAAAAGECSGDYCPADLDDSHSTTTATARSNGSMQLSGTKLPAAASAAPATAVSNGGAALSSSSLLRASAPEFERAAADEAEARRTMASVLWRMGDDKPGQQAAAITDLFLFMRSNPNIDVLNTMLKHISPGFRHTIEQGLARLEEQEIMSMSMSAAGAAAAAASSAQL